MREEDAGLIAAYCVDATGAARELDWSQLTQTCAEPGYTWLHFNYTDERVERWLRDASGVDPIIIDALLSEETRPRLLSESDGLLLTLRGVNLNPESDPEDMVSIRLWIQGQRIISTRRRKLLSVRDIRQSLENGRGPRSVGEFIAVLVERLSERVADVVDQVEERVDEIEEQMLLCEARHLRPKLANLRREMIALRRYLAPQREALARLSQESFAGFSNKDRQHFRECADKTTRYIEELDSVRDRAMVCQEELVNRLSEQMNQRMYVLSIITAVFLPLGFLTGLFGINVGGMPGADNGAGFWIFLAFLLLLLVLQLVVFRLRRWM